MSGIECNILFIIEADAETSSYVSRRSHDYVAKRIYGSCDPGVRRAQHPTVMLDSTHPNHIQMFPRSAGISVPSIVGDIHEHTRAHIFILANFIPEYRLIADESPISLSVRPEDGPVHAGIEFTDIRQEISGEEEELLVWDIFSKRHKVHLVVAACETTIRQDKVGGVI